MIFIFCIASWVILSKSKFLNMRQILINVNGEFVCLAETVPHFKKSICISYFPDFISNKIICIPGMAQCLDRNTYDSYLKLVIRHRCRLNILTEKYLTICIYEVFTHNMKTYNPFEFLTVQLHKIIIYISCTVYMQSTMVCLQHFLEFINWISTRSRL